MSEVYVKEPTTKGKALLRTTYGDLEVELWATECPKACRNFCQLILEGYYNGTVFHRVIRDFIVQGGDRTGTGDGCESIYGKPYADEIHPRLKFRYRGMLGVASAGKGTKTNGSQFFITLGRTPSLDGNHTLFGRIVGETVYNLVRISEVQVDKNDRPLEPPKVLRAELTWDPFGDLEPRTTPAPPVPERAAEEQQHRRAPVHNKRVLSFAAADSDDEDNPAAGAAGGKSAHDLLNDPKLSRQVAYPEKAIKPAQKTAAVAKDEPARRVSHAATEAAPVARERVGSGAAGAGSNSGASDGSDDDQEDDNGGVVQQERASKRQATIAMLKRDIAGLSSGAVQDAATTKRKALTALEELRQGYETRGLAKVLKGEEKRKNAEKVQGKIKGFAERIRAVAASADEPTNEDANKEGKSKGTGKEKEEKEDGTFAAIWDEGDEESTADWLSGNGLKFHTSSDKAFKLESLKARENLEIFDPLAAKGNDEVLAEVRKRRSDQMRPMLRHKAPTKAPQKRDRW